MPYNYDRPSPQRVVTLPAALWDWVHAQGGRSEIIRGLIEQAMKGKRNDRRHGFRIDGNNVRFWATKRQAVEAAKAIKWPVKSVVAVHTNFCLGYALLGGPGQGLLSRDGYGELFYRFNQPA